MNLLQYAMTVMSLFSLENFCVMSGFCCIATWEVLISRCSVGVLNSVAGQLDGSYGGPFHHSLDDASVVGSRPLEVRSAGLDGDDTCLHVCTPALVRGNIMLNGKPNQFNNIAGSLITENHW
jgi:hypothetical protein